MSAAQQSGGPARDYSSPATWGDVESARLSLEKQIADLRTDMATMEGRLEGQIADLRTDMATMEGRLEGQIADVRTDMATMEGRLEAQIAEGRLEVATLKGTVEGKLHETETRLIRWFAGATAASVGLIGVLIGILQAVD